MDSKRVLTDSPVHILLVEDNPGDVRLVQEALKESRVAAQLYVATDGVQALEFLRQHGRYAGNPKPDMLLLDLNMPKTTGIELLTTIRNDHSLRSLPVVILSSSQRRSDIDTALQLYANCYLIKPIDTERLILVLRTIKPDAGEIPAV
jgi:two-component system, chemotaxis family, response regulator Rcp1